MHVMRQHQRAIAGQIDIDDLHVGLAARQIVLPRQGAADLAVAEFVVDRLDPQRRLAAVVANLEQAELADHLRAQYTAG